MPVTALKVPEMSRHTINATLTIERPIDEVFSFFSRAENLAVITPPELGFHIRTALPIVMQVGTLIDYKIKLHGLPMHWRTLISAWDPPNRFVDEQLKGPYAEWIHTHTFTAVGKGTRIDDEVTYRLPFGPLGAVAHPLIRRQLSRIFSYRSDAVSAHFGQGRGA